MCAIVETKGYDAGLKSAVGVDRDGRVTGVEIISHKETPGLGANAEKEEFRSQFTGKSGEIAVVKSGAGENEINAISGATMTSNGVARSVNAVIAIAEAVLKERKGDLTNGKEKQYRDFSERSYQRKSYVCTASGNVSDACRYNKP